MRSIPKHVVSRFEVSKSLDESRRHLTDMLLGSVGLMVVDSDDDIVPPSVYLTAIQCEIIGQVSVYGYKVGLG